MDLNSRDLLIGLIMLMVFRLIGCPPVKPESSTTIADQAATENAEEADKDDPVKLFDKLYQSEYN